MISGSLFVFRLPIISNKLVFSLIFASRLSLRDSQTFSIRWNLSVSISQGTEELSQDKESSR